MIVDYNFIYVCFFRIFLSFCAGFVLGLERKTRQQPIGLRTLILICVSSTLLSILSVFVTRQSGSGDPARIAAGVINGIGFLGGGAIMKTGLNIKGLTSAAIIWTSAAIGLALGAGLYLPSLITLLVAVVSLVFLEKLEEKYFPQGRTKSLHLIYNTDSVDTKKITAILTACGFIVSDFNVSRSITEKKTKLQYSLKSPKLDDFEKVIEELKAVGELEKFSINDGV